MSGKYGQRGGLRQWISAVTAGIFLWSGVLAPAAWAQGTPDPVLDLPAPGTMVSLTEEYTPALLRGLTIHPDNPLAFDFIVFRGDSELAGQALEDEAEQMIKYFMTGLTVPEDQLWVNLSPYEKDRIVPEQFGQTEMGRDLLAQDYLLKQLTASLIYPEKDLGSRFWHGVYQRALAKFGTTQIPLSTFNKVWIVPETAVVIEQDNTAFVLASHLKVMLEEDYLAVNQNLDVEDFGLKGRTKQEAEESCAVTSQVVREILLPAIEEEVNNGRTFAKLRQIYTSMILAAWYKQNLRASLLGQVYVDQNKIAGVDSADKAVKDKIYNQYLQAFKQGVYNYIKLEYDPSQEKKLPRRYFSGGTNMDVRPTVIEGGIISSPVGKLNEEWKKDLLKRGVRAETIEKIDEGLRALGSDVLSDVLRVSGETVPTKKDVTVTPDDLRERPRAVQRIYNDLSPDGRNFYDKHIATNQSFGNSAEERIVKFSGLLGKVFDYVSGQTQWTSDAEFLQAEGALNLAEEEVLFAAERDLSVQRGYQNNEEGQMAALRDTLDFLARASLKAEQEFNLEQLGEPSLRKGAGVLSKELGPKNKRTSLINSDLRTGADVQNFVSQNRMRTTLVGRLVTQGPAVVPGGQGLSKGQATQFSEAFGAAVGWLNSQGITIEPITDVRIVHSAESVFGIAPVSLGRGKGMEALVDEAYLLSQLESPYLKEIWTAASLFALTPGTFTERRAVQLQFLKSRLPSLDGNGYEVLLHMLRMLEGQPDIASSAIATPVVSSSVEIKTTPVEATAAMQARAQEMKGLIETMQKEGLPIIAKMKETGELVSPEEISTVGKVVDGVVNEVSARSADPDVEMMMLPLRPRIVVNISPDQTITLSEAWDVRNILNARSNLDNLSIYRDMGPAKFQEVLDTLKTALDDRMAPVLDFLNFVIAGENLAKLTDAEGREVLDPRPAGDPMENLGALSADTPLTFFQKTALAHAAGNINGPISNGLGLIESVLDDVKEGYPLSQERGRRIQPQVGRIRGVLALTEDPYRNAVFLPLVAMGLPGQIDRLEAEMANLVWDGSSPDDQALATIATIEDIVQEIRDAGILSYLEAARNNAKLALTTIENEVVLDAAQMIASSAVRQEGLSLEASETLRREARQTQERLTDFLQRFERVVQGMQAGTIDEDAAMDQLFELYGDVGDLFGPRDGLLAATLSDSLGTSLPDSFLLGWWLPNLLSRIISSSETPDRAAILTEAQTGIQDSLALQFLAALVEGQGPVTLLVNDAGQRVIDVASVSPDLTAAMSLSSEAVLTEAQAIFERLGNILTQENGPADEAMRLELSRVSQDINSVLSRAPEELRQSFSAIITFPNGEVSDQRYDLRTRVAEWVMSLWTAQTPEEWGDAAQEIRTAMDQQETDGALAVLRQFVEGRFSELTQDQSGRQVLDLRAFSPSTSSPVRKKKYGGINLNPNLIDMQIRRDGNGVPLPVSEQPIGTMNIQGFIPVILDVAPAGNLPILQFLGQLPEGEPAVEAQIGMR